MFPACFSRWTLFLLGLASLCLQPSPAHAGPRDGILLEHPAALGRGAWNLNLGVEFGGGAEPIEGPFLTAGAKDPIKVDLIRGPLEIRYGWSDRAELGLSAAFEADDGTTIPAGGAIPGNFLNTSGIQNIRILGKWKIGQRLSWKADFAFAGKNTLADGNDGLDFGVKFMYGLKLGAGSFLINTGVTIKGGGADFNDNGVTGTAEEYDNPIHFGIGYVYPFTSRFSGILELAGGTSPFAGGSGIAAGDFLSFLLGVRAGLGESFFLSGGAAAGLMPGSPNLTARIGLDWIWGDIKSVAMNREDPDYWAPTPEDRARMAAAAAAPPVDDLSARKDQAAAAFARRDYIAAATHYEAAIGLKNDDPLLYYNLATCYFLMRRYHNARPYYLNAIRLNPGDVDSHLYLGYTHYYLKDTVSAAREWRRVLELDPANQLARDNLAAMGVP